MVEDNLTVYDVKSVLLSGLITRHQRDELDYKYVTVGETTAADEATACVSCGNETVELEGDGRNTPSQAPPPKKNVVADLKIRRARATQTVHT